MKGPGHGQSPSEAMLLRHAAQPTDSKADAETTSTGQDHPAVRVATIKCIAIMKRRHRAAECNFQICW